MNRTLIVCLVLSLSPSVVAQTINVDVWTLTRPGSPPLPSSTAAVRISTAANVPAGSAIRPQQPTAGGPRQNQYSLDASQFGSLVDIICRQTGHHPWAARDLYVGSGADQNINVQLFRHDYPIKAPQCFALKTEYELLFRKEQRLFRNEQRLSPEAARKEIEHLARVKYANGILALPNPSRQDFQSEETRQMLADMTDDDRDELNNMLNGLFNLYEMDGFERYVPSLWQTSYVAVNRQTVNCEVRLFGNHGTYTTSSGRHLLENVDFFTEENADGGGTDVISGNWRFAPGNNNESRGTFRWQVDGGETHFEGFFQRDGDSNRFPWTGDRVEQPIQGELEVGVVDNGLPAPEVNRDAVPPPAPRIPGRVPAPRPAAERPPAPPAPAREVVPPAPSAHP
jgi:hypothetical protein